MRRLFPLLTLLLLMAGGAQSHEQEFEDAGSGAGGEPEARCEAGLAAVFPCSNVDLLAWVPTAVFGQPHANDIWGWADPSSGREYALIGLRGGTAFVEVTDPTEPVYLGLLPSHSGGSSWRDIKTYAGYAFIVSEAPAHGMQIFDLGALEHVESPPVVFSPSGHYASFGNSHNLALDETTGLAFAVGTATCNGGLHIVDVRRPLEPLFAGCFGDDGYTHDAQCIVYHGPDFEHHNREICFNSNEDTVTIVDATSAEAPRMLSRNPYTGSGYTHQGWIVDDHRYFLSADEFDEIRNGHRPRTYVWDIQDLDAPFVAGVYSGEPLAIDHNVFVRGNHVFQASYLGGLRVLRLGDLARGEMVEVGSFDTTPFNNGFIFSGAWGTYPFLPSGIVLVSDITNGLFVLRPHLDAVPECSDGIDNDRDGRTDSAEDPACAAGHGASELPRNDVAIDVMPGNCRNPFNPSARGPVRVAVLGAPSFDVRTIDRASLRFGPADTPPGRRGSTLRDVDRDLDLDLIVRFGRRASDVDACDAQVCLRWQTHDATPYEACDSADRAFKLRFGRTSG